MNKPLQYEIQSNLNRETRNAMQYNAMQLNEMQCNATQRHYTYVFDSDITMNDPLYYLKNQTELFGTLNCNTLNLRCLRFQITSLLHIYNMLIRSRVRYAVPAINQNQKTFSFLELLA